MDTNEEHLLEEFIDKAIDIFSYIAIGAGLLLIIGSIIRIMFI